MAFEFSSPGLMAILAEVGADFVLPPDGASAVESLVPGSGARVLNPSIRKSELIL
jgi:hypothetical protein